MIDQSNKALSTQTAQPIEINLGPLDTLPPRQFTTERLSLRAAEASDARQIFDSYASDEEATKYMSFKCTKDFKDTLFFFENTALYFNGKKSPIESFTWVVTLKGDEKIIGSLGFGIKNEHSLTGGYIFDKKHWGHGYASEAWKCLLDWCKTQPRVFRVEAHYDVANPASRRVMEKSGMTFEGILKRYSLSPNVSNEPRDTGVCAWTKP